MQATREGWRERESSIAIINSASAFCRAHTRRVTRTMPKRVQILSSPVWLCRFTSGSTKKFNAETNNGNAWKNAHTHASTRILGARRCHDPSEMRLWNEWRYNKATHKHTLACRRETLEMEHTRCRGEKASATTKNARIYNVFSITCQNLYFHPTLGRSCVRFGISCCYRHLCRTSSFIRLGTTKMGRLITWETEYRRTHYAF